MKKIIPVIAVSILGTAFISPIYAADEVKEKAHEVSKKQDELNEKQAELNKATQDATDKRALDANKTMQQVSRASKITGAKVQNTTGESLGEVMDLVIDPSNGQVVYAVVSFGGIMGMGDKLFAIPWRALHWTSPKDYYVLDLDKVTLKNAPGFDKKHWPQNSEKWEEQREALSQFYRVASQP